MNGEIGARDLGLVGRGAVPSEVMRRHYLLVVLVVLVVVALAVVAARTCTGCASSWAP